MYVRSGNHRERTMLSLLWDLEELKQDGRTELSNALDVVDMPLALRTHHNLPRKLSLIQSNLCGEVVVQVSNGVGINLFWANRLQHLSSGIVSHLYDVFSGIINAFPLYNQLQHLRVLMAVLIWFTFTKLRHTTLPFVGLPFDVNLRAREHTGVILNMFVVSCSRAVGERTWYIPLVNSGNFTSVCTQPHNSTWHAV